MNVKHRRSRGEGKAHRPQESIYEVTIWRPYS